MLKVLFIGSSCEMSVTFLNGMLQRGVQICGIAEAASDSKNPRFPIVDPAASFMSLPSCAQALKVPHIQLLPGREAETLKRINPDLIVVCCYPRLLPQHALDVPKYGCYNLHPSMLPLFRGPDPLFWQFYYGVVSTGVTLHSMTGDIDAGPIVDQRSWCWVDGINYATAVQMAVNAGAELVENLVADLYQSKLQLSFQNTNKPSYHGWPDEEAFSLPASWSARRLFNFIRGTRHMGNDYMINIGKLSFRVSDALSYSSLGKADNHLNYKKNVVKIDSGNGSLRVLINHCEVTA